MKGVIKGVMKGEFKNDNYSLSNIDIFRPLLNNDVKFIITKFIDLVIKYLYYITENFKNKNTEYRKFVIIRGLDTMSHVFFFLLFYTNNLDVTVFHCEKAFYFYVEFMSQISTEEKTYLQLSSRDAANYVYKKTIFDLKPDSKKQKGTDITKYITTYLSIFKSIIYIVINQINENDTENNIGLEVIEDILKKINLLSLDYTLLIFLENIIELLYYKLDKHLFTDWVKYLLYYVLKNNKTLEIMEKKRTNELIDVYLKKDMIEFMQWFTND
jgi:hypothetical protein